MLQRGISDAVSPRVTGAVDISHARRYKSGMEQLHPLARYAAASGRSLSELAIAAGTSRQSLHRIIKGEQMPSLDLVARLKHATGGAVTADDFLPAMPASAPRETEATA